MAANVIISYDGTANDDDALALGRRLAHAGLTLELAYVRHAREFDIAREELAQHDAEQRLARGAALLGDEAVERHVVFGASTGQRLQELAMAEGAGLILFGSDYRTPPGRSEPGTSAQRLLEGGTVAVGIAAAGLRRRPAGWLDHIAVPLSGPPHEVARRTAQELAERLGARVTEGRGPADLIVVGSAPTAPSGQISISGDVRAELSSARSSVLVLPAGEHSLF